MTPWETDVAVAESLALTGRGNPEVARVLVAEVHRLRTLAGEDRPIPALVCPRCGRTADRVEKELGQPARYQHGQVTHLDLSADLKVVRP